MAECYISEYREAAITGPGQGVPAGMEPELTSQKVTFTTATQSAVFTANTHLVRVQCDAASHIKFGPNPTATTNDKPMNANAGEYFGVIPGQRLSVVAA